MLFNHGLSPAYAKATAGRRTALTNVRAGRAWTPAAPHWLVTVCSSFALAITSFAADPAITVEALQRYPWNGLVDLNFTITGTSGTKYATSFTAKDMVGNTNITMQTIRKSDGTAAAATEQLIPGTYNWVWDAAADLPNDFQCDRVTVSGTIDISAFTYAVKFNANGGTGTMSNESFTYGTAKALTANAFTRTGYMFQGWATSASGSKVYNDKQSVSNLTTTAGATVNLYAKWSGSSYSVKFNANGGSGTMANESFTYGTAKALTANAFTRTGYAFQGWATSASGAKVYNDKQSISNLTATAGAVVNLYAVWGDHGKVQLWAGGPYWATTNIGADSPEDCGYYFWWGDTVGYKRKNGVWIASDGSSSNFAFSSANTPTYNKTPSTLENEGWVVLQDGTYVISPEHDAAHVQWGGDWRMPTYQEMYDLCCNKCDWTWTTMNGVNGYEVRGRGNYASASIFFPAAGHVPAAGSYYDGTELEDAGSIGCYWLSVPYSGNNYLAYELGFNSDASRLEYFDYLSHYNYRDDGQSIRPVQGGE